MINDNNIKVHRGRHYVSVPGEIFRNNDISLKAKGLYAMLYSLPEDWNLTVHGLTSILREGKSAIYSALNELKQYGYVRIVESRDENGRIKPYEYHFFDMAVPPLTDFPQADNPETEKPHTENRTQSNNVINNNSKEYSSSSSCVCEVFVKKDDFPAFDVKWAYELMEFIEKVLKQNISYEYIRQTYDEFVAEQKAKWTDETKVTHQQFREHYANYLRKNVSKVVKAQQEKRALQPKQTSFFDAIAKTDKELADKKRGTMSYEQYQQLKQSNNGKT